MVNFAFRTTHRPPSSGGNSNSPSSKKPAEGQVTLDEMQEMARNGKLEHFLNSLGIPALPATVKKAVKRRMGEGESFDRETFNQEAYDKRLLNSNK